jgi:cyclophilin family peptidyl-prolyl cis-trans isomerase
VNDSTVFAVVFGRVLDGFDIVDKVQSMKVDRAAKPLKPVTIADCGTLDA